MREKIVLFGAGKRLDRGIMSLDYTYDIVCIYDNSTKKQHTDYCYESFNGEKKNIGIRDFEKDEIIADATYVITPIKWKEIYMQLTRKGIKKIRLMCNYLDRNKGFNKELADYIRHDIIKLKMEEEMIEQEEMICWDIWDNHYVKPYIIEDLENYIQIHKNDRILDYGCGCGSLFLNLKTSGFLNVAGVEVDLIKFDYCNSKINYMEYPNSWKNNIVLYDGENLPYEDESFDIVVSDMVLEHVQSVRESLGEMLRVLKKGGSLYIHAPNYNFDWEPHYRIKFGKNIRGNTEEFHDYLLDMGLDTELFDSINFIGPEDILEVYREYGQAEVIDNSTQEVCRILLKKI